MYRLPRNVTHTGALHVELSYTPGDGDCFRYLLGPVAKGSQEWQVCPGPHAQGFLSLRPGREVVDYAVPQVLDQDAVDDGVRGDVYYAVVQAASGVSRVRLTGYGDAQGHAGRAGERRAGRDGAWRLTVRVRRTTRRRAVAQPASGLAVEYSLVKRTVVAR